MLYTVIQLSIHSLVLVQFCGNMSTVFLGSAYTEPFPVNSISTGLSAEEDHGRTSEEEEGVGEPSFDPQVRHRIQRQMEAG